MYIIKSIETKIEWRDNLIDEGLLTYIEKFIKNRSNAYYCNNYDKSLNNFLNIQKFRTENEYIYKTMGERIEIEDEEENKILIGIRFRTSFWILKESESSINQNKAELEMKFMF